MNVEPAGESGAMTDKPDLRQGERKPFYNVQQRSILARLFGAASLPLLEEAAWVLSDLKSNPIGRVDGCRRCSMIRVRVLDQDGLPTWDYVRPIVTPQTDDVEVCPKGDQHEWRKYEARSAY